jgi:hypothetical protein
MTDNIKFRSLKEVERYLEKMRQQIRDDMQLAEEQTKKLQAMSRRALKATEFKILDISGGPGYKVKKKTIGVNFPVVKVPNKEVLTKNYTLAEKLTEQFKELEAQENTVKMTFRGNPAADRLLGEFAKLKSDLEKQMRTLFQELSNVAKGHAPKEYKDFVQELANELNENQYIECDEITNFTYVSVDKEGNLVFAGYIVMNNAISDEGEEIPHLYVTLKWTVGGNVEVFVEHDFVQPGLLTGGVTIGSVQEAAKAITRQLAMEGFSSQIGNLPVSMQVRMPENKEAFTAAPFVNSISSEGDKLIFSLKPEGVKNLEQIKGQLFLEVKGMLKKKRSTGIRMRVIDNDVIFTFTNLDQSGGVTPHDLEFLEDKYRLTQQQLRKIANEINND